MWDRGLVWKGFGTSVMRLTATKNKVNKHHLVPVWGCLEPPRFIGNLHNHEPIVVLSNHREYTSMTSYSRVLTRLGVGYVACVFIDGELSG